MRDTHKNPTNPDTDGDGVWDGDEVPHSPGSCPNDADDGGDPANCVTLRLTVGDPSGSHSERWNLDVFEEATGRAAARHCDNGFGSPGSAEYALVKGKVYNFRLRWIATASWYIGTPRPDYDWRAFINDSTEEGAREGLYGTGVFIVEDPCGLLTEYTDGGAYNLTAEQEGRIIVPKIKLEPVTYATTGAGVIVNPSGVAAGGLAAYRVGVEPEDEVEDDDINWSAANGGVTFYGGRDTGREVIVRGGAAGSDFKLEVRIGGAPATACPYIHGRVLEPKTVPIHAYIICSNGVPAVSVYTVDAWIAEANRIYKQAAMSFYVAGVEYVASNDWFVIENSTEFHQMCSYTNVTAGLELYCVSWMSSAGAHSNMLFGPDDPRCGMAVRASATASALAHEIGHACFLKDIKYALNDLVCEGLAGALNWSGGDGTGYHDPALKHQELAKRLIMYYQMLPTITDIPLGSVVGTYKVTGAPETNTAPVACGLDYMEFMGRNPCH